MSTPLSRQMDQIADAQEWKERAEAAESKLAEALADLEAERQVNLPTTHAMNLTEKLRRAEAEVERLRAEMIEVALRGEP